MSKWTRLYLKLLQQTRRALIYTAIVLLATLAVSGAGIALSHDGDLRREVTAFSSSSVVNAVVEIPTGTREKWEWDTDIGDFVWDEENGRKRVIRYSIAYPGNYGMIPQTAGGDGDPLDVLVLGEQRDRGDILRARVIAVLNMKDGGERDDKIIAVNTEDDFVGDVASLDDLNERFPGTLEIVALWFSNYKMKLGEMVLESVADEREALAVVREAHEAFHEEM